MTTITFLINESSENFLQCYPQIKKFRKNSLLRKTFYQKLVDYFLLNNNDELPIAAVTALAENYLAQEGWWLRADPVQLHVDMSHVYLIGNQHLDFSKEEINQLVTELNQFLKQDHLKLITANKNEWFIQLDHDPQIKTFALPDVTGKIIMNYLPQGKNANYWKKLLTEIQMLLSASEINKKRKAENKPMINSLWFWGEGRLPEIKQNYRWKKVYGNDNLTKGLALLTATPFVSINEYLPPNDPGDYLLVSDIIIPEFFTQISQIKFVKIILDFANGDCFEFDSKQLRYWWQRIF